jgi:hypothetical protein
MIEHVLILLLTVGLDGVWHPGWRGTLKGIKNGAYFYQL